jgi:hypothetical protein
MPTVAHWVWNSNARRYWDFSVAGGIPRIEWQVHHYGSPLNAIPLLDHYQYDSNPSSSLALHDLRVGYAGWLGALTNINDDGFAAQAFHAWPDTLQWDTYSSDYGCGLLGHMLSSATYLVESLDFGYLSFGGNLQGSGEVITVQSRDMVKWRIYAAPLGIRFEIDTGTKFVSWVTQLMLLRLFTARALGRLSRMRLLSRIYSLKLKVTKTSHLLWRRTTKSANHVETRT